MKTIWILLAAAALVAAAVVGGWLLTRPTNPGAPQAIAQASTAAEPVAAPPPSESPKVAPPAAIETVTPAIADPPATNALAAKPATKPAGTKKRELQDPLAREAMALVGMDADAEAYWLDAIYDTSLPDSEREDLMEDLNEDGLSDTKHPGPQDLPLILNRLAIIEEVAMNADAFMLRHLGEAYKDLWNLAQITQGGGQPVR